MLHCLLCDWSTWTIDSMADHLKTCTKTKQQTLDSIYEGNGLTYVYPSEEGTRDISSFPATHVTADFRRGGC